MNKPSQEVSPKPTAPPIQNSYKILFYICLFLLIFVLVAAGSYFLGTKSGEGLLETKIQEGEKITPAPLSVPEENVLYFGTYEGSEAVFFTNKSRQNYFKDGVKKTSPEIGELRKENGEGLSPFEFKNLTNPKKLAVSFGVPIAGLTSLKLNSSKTLLFVSLDLEAKANETHPLNLVNKIYQVDLLNLTGKEIWSKDIGLSQKYEGAEGDAILEVVNDQYLAFWLVNCYACEGGQAGMVFLNLKTKKEKYLKVPMGNLEFDLTNNKVSYQKLLAVEEPCTEGYGCSEGKMTVKKPSGQVYSEVLP